MTSSAPWHRLFSAHPPLSPLLSAEQQRLIALVDRLMLAVVVGYTTYRELQALLRYSRRKPLS